MDPQSAYLRKIESERQRRGAFAAKVKELGELLVERHGATRGNIKTHLGIVEAAIFTLENITTKSDDSVAFVRISPLHK